MKKIKRIGMVVALIEEQQHLIKSFGVFVKNYQFGEIKVSEFDYKDCKIFMADSGVGEIWCWCYFEFWRCWIIVG